MEIKNNFEVPLPPVEAWNVLMDIPRVVPCVPGAELVEMVDDRTFKGKVAVKLGPIALVFNGTAHFDEINEQTHSVRATAQGADTKGRGGANATVRFNLTPVPAGTRVDVVTDVNLSGSVAQYGRGTGIIQSVATQLVNQFAANLHAMLGQQPDMPVPASAEAPHAGEDSPVRAAPFSPQPAPAKPISGFGLMMSVLWQSLVRLFSRKRDS